MLIQSWTLNLMVDLNGMLEWNFLDICHGGEFYHYYVDIITQNLRRRL